jgi:hypothetical protein
LKFDYLLSLWNLNLGDDCGEKKDAVMIFRNPNFRFPCALTLCCLIKIISIHLTLSIYQNYTKLAITLVNVLEMITINNHQLLTNLFYSVLDTFCSVKTKEE